MAVKCEKSWIRYWGAVAIAQVAGFSVWRGRPIPRLQLAKKYSTAGVERREGHPSRGGWKAVLPTLPQKGRARGAKLTCVEAPDGACGTLE